MVINTNSGHKSDDSNDYQSLISLKMSKNYFTEFVEAPPKTNRLVRRSRKQTVCWRDTEN